MTWIAGLNHWHHDASAALLRDGEVVVVVEQERVSRRKRAVDEGPAGALRACLDFAGIELGDLDHVAVGYDLRLMRRWLGRGADAVLARLPYESAERLFPAELFGPGPRPGLTPVAHHLAHAFSVAWASGLDDAAVLVVDNRGESASTSIGTVCAGVPTLVEAHPVADSLGLFYRIASQYAGFYQAGDTGAGKLMGLAAYGRTPARVPLAVTEAGARWDLPAPGVPNAELVAARTAQLLEWFARHCFPFEAANAEEATAYADFARGVQGALEQALLALAGRALAAAGSRDLLMAGGVALNCSANGRIADSGLVDRLVVNPLANDAGVGLGAAFAVAHRLGLPRPAPLASPYLGPSFTAADADAALTGAGLRGERLPDDELARRTAACLARGGLVAWCQGRAEVGPRALGARSLLADPRRRATVARVNRLKGREMWRPLAPSVLEERFGDYFAGTPNPHMLVAVRVRPEVARAIPAVVHVDGTARPQSVARSANPLFHRLIAEFERAAGVPMVLNTSLNVAGQPIALTPADAVAMALALEVDAIAVGPLWAEVPRAGRGRRLDQAALLRA